MARLLMEDMKGLSRVGLNGMISCQCQRVFFPTGLGMHAMAAGLWDKNADFDALAAWYFENAFGEDADAVHGYLRQVSEYMDPVYLRGEKEAVDPAVAEGYRALERLVDDFEPVIRQKIGAGADANWRALLPHAGLMRRMAKMLALRASGEQEAAAKAWDETVSYVWEIEKDVHELFDVYIYIATLKLIMK